MARGGRALIASTSFAHGLVHAYVLLIPVLIPVWLLEFRADPFLLGLVAAAAYALYGLGALPFGLLADRRRAHPLLLASLGGMGAALLLAAVAPGLPSLALGLALLGMAASVYHPTGLALLSRRFNPPGIALGWHGLGGSLGIALGPLAASLLLLALPWPAVVALFALPAALGLVLLHLADPREGSAGEPGSSAAAALALLRRPAFLLVLAVYVTAGTAYWGALTFLPAFINGGAGLAPLLVGGRPLAPATLLFPTLLALGSLGQLLSGHLSDRPRPEATLALLCFLEAACLAALALARGWPLIPLALALGFLLFALEPLQNILIIHRIPPGQWGFAFGMAFVSVFGLGGMLGAPLAGYLASTRGYASLFPAMAPFMAASGLAALALGRRRGGRGGPSSR